MGASTSKIKIAVIEDSDLIRKSIVDALEKEGYQVIGNAKTAKEAMQIIANGQAQLFIVDVVLPEVSGIELAKKINESSMSVKIIMMSSLNLESIVIESISNGAVDFISKPFEMSDMINAVKKVEEELLKDN
jgi:two-component system chemotaxis response regulator CheY